ncbi:MAG: 16S rRNA (guanine(966)-N(2))-methyltransferase RsmD [Streptosporangiales bacterium]|nr:16S rRNA (guanine(966)-N(2))-methyltransferase RsmD [Streptosporangiales bacterium]
MSRVIAGAAGGRRLAVPPGQSTRPTSDRAREGLFGTVLSELGTLDGRHVLDLYAGSGAVGLEALSRGAESVILVESDARAASVIKSNIRAVDLPGARVVTSRAEKFLSGPAPEKPQNRFDLMFADPPYAVTAEAITKILTMLAGGGWLADEALIVVERATRSGALDWPPGYTAGKSRRYGEATFWYGWHSTACAHAYEE